MPTYNLNGCQYAAFPGENANRNTALQLFTRADSGTGFVGTGQPATGTRSQQIELSGPYARGGPISFSVEIEFDSSPGNFEFDVQESDTDSPDFYITIGGAGGAGAITTATQGTVSLVPGGTAGTKYVARVDLETSCRFISVYCKTQNANGVKCQVFLNRPAA